MKKKLLFLSVALALCAMPASVLTSCSDEPTPMDVAKSDVSGTKWIGLNNYSKPMILKFKKDGTFSLDVKDSAGSYAKGEYVQRGTTIEFYVTSTWAFWHEFDRGTISNGGGTLTVPMYYDDGDLVYEASFVLDI